MAKQYQYFISTNQFRLLRVHPNYHILVKCRQQVADAIILDWEFLIALIILVKAKLLILQCASNILFSKRIKIIMVEIHNQQTKSLLVGVISCICSVY